MTFLRTVLLLIGYLSLGAAFSQWPSHRTARGSATELFQSNFFDNLVDSLGNTKSLTSPKVEVPDELVIPEPRPLAISAETDILKFSKNNILA